MVEMALADRARTDAVRSATLKQIDSLRARHAELEAQIEADDDDEDAAILLLH